mmetsp:Transcript_15822/g.37274  ORF Transcript_15822/g.37274 Transcript_15822/m.37274 type:complete len:483 (+) Transcript_15822:69-1517(+)
MEAVASPKSPEAGGSGTLPKSIAPPAAAVLAPGALMQGPQQQQGQGGTSSGDTGHRSGYTQQASIESLPVEIASPTALSGASSPQSATLKQEGHSSSQKLRANGTLSSGLVSASHVAGRRHFGSANASHAPGGSSSTLSRQTTNRQGLHRKSTAGSLLGRTLSGFSEKSEVPTELYPMPELRESKEVILASADCLEQWYAVGEILGNGSFGTVWKCKCKRTGQDVAVKSVPTSSFEDDEDAAEKEKKEMDIFKKLSHHNIARLFEVFKDDKAIHFVQELCSGGDLIDVMNNRMAPSYQQVSFGLPPQDVARLLWQMLSGAAYLHHHRFVHRDIKPENYMLSNSGSNAVLKLIDFGLACRYKKGRRLTDVVGTAMYVAPEVLRQSYCEKCDMWSIGGVTYVLSCGTPPFTGKSEEEVLKKVIQGAYQKDSPYFMFLDPELRALICRMMCLPEAERPSAKALIKESEWLRSKVNPSANCCCVVQ